MRQSITMQIGRNKSKTLITFSSLLSILLLISLLVSVIHIQQTKNKKDAKHASRIYGVLNVCLQQDISEDKKEQQLLEELANDISFALYNIELKEKHEKAEEKLHKNEQTFRHLVENAFDAIYFMNGRHYEYVNQRFCEITGYTIDELTSPSFDFEALLTEQSKDIVEERYKARQRGEKVPNQYEIQLKSKDGNLKYVELTTVSMDHESNGNEVKVMGIMRETTQRRKAEKELIEAKKGQKKAIS